MDYDIKIPYGKHELDEEDIEAVLDTLRSDFLTQGSKVPEFEHAITKVVDAKFAIATNSATSALHVALVSMGVGHGDIVWTVPNSFVASANCALYCGATVDFIDIDSETFNLCIKSLSRKLLEAEKNHKLPKVIIPVHFAGNPCEMKEIHSLSIKYGFKILEDASHALGASYGKEKIGNCRFSDITVFSFHPVKMITTAEGGMALTNDKILAENMRLLRTHGISKNHAQFHSNADGPWSYQQLCLGFNYRMSDIHASLGLSQLKKLENFVKRRNEIAETYENLLTDLPLTLPLRQPNVNSSFHLYVIQLKDENKSKRAIIFNRLREKNIGVNVHYIPIHTQPYYTKLGFKIGDFPVSEDYYNRAISLPIYPSLNKTQQNYIASILAELL